MFLFIIKQTTVINASQLNWDRSIIPGYRFWDTGPRKSQIPVLYRYP